MNRRDATESLRNLGENLLKVNARHERLIDALLALARSDSGTMECLPTDLGRLAETVLAHAAESAREAGITVSSDLDAAPLQGDPTLLEQLTRNLVDNAIRYNHHGGTVHVTTRLGPDAAVLVVTNTGPSIAPSEVPTLFQPFRRLTDRVDSAKEAAWACPSSRPSPIPTAVRPGPTRARRAVWTSPSLSPFASRTGKSGAPPYPGSARGTAAGVRHSARSIRWDRHVSPEPASGDLRCGHAAVSVCSAQIVLPTSS